MTVEELKMVLAWQPDFMEVRVEIREGESVQVKDCYGQNGFFLVIDLEGEE